MTVEGCGSASLQGDVRFAEVMGLMGAKVEWSPYSITITGVQPSTESRTALLMSLRMTGVLAIRSGVLRHRHHPAQ